MVVNPKASDSDPLAQRGHVGWKGYSATIILNDFWMVRLEVAVSDLT
jgi:N4-gp56 family major capsid protein